MRFKNKKRLEIRSSIFEVILMLALSVFQVAIIFYGIIFSDRTKYSTCFTPSTMCREQIIDEIDSAKDSIYVMAYGFTSTPITNALLRAKSRGVDVNILLDKSNVSAKKYLPYTFTFYNIPVYIDYRPPIAHNKVMIIDGETTITGSYNFTGNAQKNAENVIFIRNKKIADTYIENWMYRHSQSTNLNAYKIK